MTYFRTVPKQRQCPEGEPTDGCIRPDHGRRKPSRRLTTTGLVKRSHCKSIAKSNACQSKRVNSSKRKVPRQTVAPATIRGKLGWSQMFPGQRQLVVYGSFDRVGRFCRRIGTKELKSNGRPKRLEASPIKHEDVKYYGPLQGMADAEVRCKVYRTLEKRYGPILDEGVM